MPTMMMGHTHFGQAVFDPSSTCVFISFYDDGVECDLAAGTLHDTYIMARLQHGDIDTNTPRISNRT